MTLHQLRAFLSVVRLGSVRAAAEELYVSQPAVSAALSALADEVGIALFERDGRGLQVTPAGHAFAAEVERGVAHLDRAPRVARGTQDPEQGIATIASIATAAERIVIPHLGAFRRRHPAATVNIEVGNRARVWDALRRLDADLVVAGRPPVDAEVEVLGTAANTLVLVGIAPFPSRGVRNRLAMTTWLLREQGSGTREAAERVIAELDIDPPRMVIGSNGAVTAAVAAGFGVGLLPRSGLDAPLAQGQVEVIRCPGTPMDRPWHLVSAGPAAGLSPTARLVAAALLASELGFSPTAAGQRLLRSGDAREVER